MWLNKCIQFLTPIRIVKRGFTSLDRTQSPFSIYIHWPYCESKCTYCNFNKYVNPTYPPHERLVSAIKTELDYFLNDSKYNLKKRPIHSIYFGGGTPSLTKPSDIASILDTIDGIVGLNRDVEISMEANSTSCESSKLVGFKEAGINRLSLGIQALNDVDLKVLGRDHSANEALDALSRAKTVFRPERVSCDLIYARPGQSLEDWRKELTTALSIAGDHISIYQLTIERSTPIDKQLRKGLIPPVPEGDIIADMHEETIRIATEFGYHHYEVSNYAKNQQAIGRHNFSYWQGMDYLGIGPGSHGRLTDQTTNRRIRTFGEFHPNKYMSLCENEGEGIRKLAPIPIQEMAEELIVFGMRTRMGITRARFTTMTQGLSLEQYINKDALKLFVDSKLLIDESGFSGNHAFVPAELMSEWEGGGIRPTEAGLQRIDYILPRLFEL